MNVRELVFRGEDKTALYACGECGKVFSPKAYITKDDVSRSTARRAAEECCAPRHCACGEQIEKYLTACHRCRERSKLRKAQVIDASGYTGPVYAEHSGSWGEGYSADVDDLIEWCDSCGKETPAYCHPCTSMPLCLNADSILEMAVDDMHEDAVDQIEAADELVQFIERWNAKQTCIAYFADTKRVIVLDQERFEALIRNIPLSGEKEGRE